MAAGGPALDRTIGTCERSALRIEKDDERDAHGFATIVGYEACFSDFPELLAKVSRA